MTHIMNITSSQFDTNRAYKYYTVEVVTFDGDSQTLIITARTSEAAQEIAASQVENADYTMVQAIQTR